MDLQKATYNDIIYFGHMDNFNKIVSFVLGLVVVIVFLAVITGRFNLKKNLVNLGGKARVTPTATLNVGQNASPTSASVAAGKTKTTDYKTTGKTPTSIPATGSPTLLLSAFFSTLSLGVYLKRKK